MQKGNQTYYFRRKYIGRRGSGEFCFGKVLSVVVDNTYHQTAAAVIIYRKNGVSFGGEKSAVVIEVVWCEDVCCFSERVKRTFRNIWSAAA